MGSFYISFDATLNGSAIEEKMLRSTSDGRKELPFGFTGLDYAYLTDGTMLPRVTNVPRYCITMDGDENSFDLLSVVRLIWCLLM